MKRRILVALLTTFMVSTLVAPVVLADAESKVQEASGLLCPPVIIILDNNQKIDLSGWKKISTIDLVKERVYIITDDNDNFVGYYRYKSKTCYEDTYVSTTGRPVGFHIRHEEYYFVKVDRDGNEITGQLETFQDDGSLQCKWLRDHRIYCEK